MTVELNFLSTIMNKRLIIKTDFYDDFWIMNKELIIKTDFYDDCWMLDIGHISVYT